MHSQKNSDYIKNYIIVFIVLLVIINLAEDKNEHIDEVALSNMATMYNNGNITATDLTITGKINFKNGDNTVTTLTNPGNKLLTSDSNINANGLVVGQTVDPDWHYGIAIGDAANIEAVTGKIKHNTGWQMYGNGAAWFPADINVTGPIIATGGVKGDLSVKGGIWSSGVVSGENVHAYGKDKWLG